MRKLNEAEEVSVSQYDVKMIHAVKQYIDFKNRPDNSPALGHRTQPEVKLYRYKWDRARGGHALPPPKGTPILLGTNRDTTPGWRQDYVRFRASDQQ